MSKPASNAVLVRILDREYQVACPPEERNALQDAAKQLDQRMRDIRSGGHVIGLERIAVMAALNLSHELLQAKHQGAAAAMPDLTPLLNRIDKTLEQID
ncbi:cell division protein ZapA [Simiduia aestuariiviva]|uniref:Cell division protein ZapA n=1 Tax=Simiduia aestuariiviva TaxID=1510459 RepID=A0A839UMY3_9GAMM|nr:cell division protein ZapA [Simiduia aestuariiviva]MBB3167106.1 cell division protein ZapA [Simiduia aestuariiviva]